MRTKKFADYLKMVFIVLVVFFTGLLISEIKVSAYTSTSSPYRTLNMGETCKVHIYCGYRDGGKSFSWKSSNPDIVTITDTTESIKAWGGESDAFLSAIAPGDAQISALVDGKVKKTFWIQVTRPSLNITRHTMYVGETLKLSQTGIKDVIWRELPISKKSLVSITRLNSSSVEIKALKAGSTAIEAYNNYSRASLVACVIDIKKVPKSTNILTAQIGGKTVKFYQRYAGSVFSGERNLYYISYYPNGYIQYVMQIKFIRSEMEEGSYNSSTRPHDDFFLTKYNEKTHKPQSHYHAQGKNIYGTTYPKGSYDYKITYCASERGNITFNLNMKGCDEKTKGKTLKVTNGKLDYTLEKIHKTVQKNRSKQDIKIQYISDSTGNNNYDNNNNYNNKDNNSGTQLKKCNFCHGSGNCHVCHGSGGSSSTFLGNLKWHKCSICHGTGICSHCHGSGYKK